MKYSMVLSASSMALTAFAEPMNAQRDVSVATNVLDQISSAIIKLDASVKAFDGNDTQVQKNADNLVAALKAGTNKITAAGEISLTDAMGLQEDVQALGTAGLSLMQDLESKKGKFEAAGLCTQAGSLVQSIGNTVQSLVSGVITQLPLGIQDMAQQQTGELTDILNQGLSAFNAESCKDVAFASQAVGAATGGVSDPTVAVVVTGGVSKPTTTVIAARQTEEVSTGDAGTPTSTDVEIPTSDKFFAARQTEEVSTGDAGTPTSTDVEIPTSDKFFAARQTEEVSTGDAGTPTSTDVEIPTSDKFFAARQTAGVVIVTTAVGSATQVATEGGVATSSVVIGARETTSCTEEEAVTSPPAALTTPPAAVTTPPATTARTSAVPSSPAVPAVSESTSCTEEESFSSPPAVASVPSTAPVFSPSVPPTTTAATSAVPSSPVVVASESTSCTEEETVSSPPTVASVPSTAPVFSSVPPTTTAATSAVPSFPVVGTTLVKSSSVPPAPFSTGVRPTGSLVPQPSSMYPIPTAAAVANGAAPLGVAAGLAIALML